MGRSAEQRVVVTCPLIEKYANSRMGRRSKKTTMAYAGDLVNFCLFLASQNKDQAIANKTDDQNLIDANSEQVTQYIQHLESRFERATVMKRAVILRSFYRFLIDQNKINTNPTAELHGLKYIPKERPVVSQDDVKKLLSVLARNRLGIRDRIILRLICERGLKVSTLRRLNISDIEVTDGKTLLHVPVGRSNDRKRSIEIPEDLAREIQNYIRAGKNQKPKAPLLTNRYRGRISVRSINRNIIEHMERAGLDERITPLELRKVYVRRLVEMGFQPTGIRELVGPINMIELAKLCREQKKELMAV